MKDIPRSKWHRVLKGLEPLSVRIVCPTCGGISRLDHDIADNGCVTPSVVCANEGCSFHRWICLVDWDKGNTLTSMDRKLEE